jgi:hypothetical protein
MNVLDVIYHYLNYQCINVLVHQCIKRSLGDTHYIINASHAQLWEIEMIMHDTFLNIELRVDQFFFKW